MYRAEIICITIGPSQLEKYKVHLSVDYHGIEEEAVFRFAQLFDIPRFLFVVKDGKVKYHKGKVVYVSHPHHDANGLIFQHIWQDKDVFDP